MEINYLLFLVRVYEWVAAHDFVRPSLQGPSARLVEEEGTAGAEVMQGVGSIADASFTQSEFDAVFSKIL